MTDTVRDTYKLDKLPSVIRELRLGHRRTDGRETQNDLVAKMDLVLDTSSTDALRRISPLFPGIVAKAQAIAGDASSKGEKGSARQNLGLLDFRLHDSEGVEIFADHQAQGGCPSFTMGPKAHVTQVKIPIEVVVNLDEFMLLAEYFRVDTHISATGDWKPVAKQEKEPKKTKGATPADDADAARQTGLFDEANAQADTERAAADAPPDDVDIADPHADADDGDPVEDGDLPDDPGDDFYDDKKGGRR